MRRIKRRLRLFTLRLRRRMSVGLALSLALHAAVVALLLFRFAMQPPPAGFQMLVDLVQTGNGAEQAAAGSGGTATGDAQPARTPRPDRRAPQAGTKATQNIGELLREAEIAHGVTAPASRDDGGGGSGTGASDGHAAGGAGRMGLKDFIRAQIERRWQFERANQNAREIIVQIKLVIDADGNVESAQIVDDRTTDADFHAAAIGARNAALLSSPLQLPPGTWITGAITVDLNTKDALR
jgi:outer membrane biosynthesis protein TonB